LNNRRGKPLDFDDLWALFFFNDRLFPESILLPFLLRAACEIITEAAKWHDIVIILQGT
jgi:hypothetical protein